MKPASDGPSLPLPLRGDSLFLALVRALIQPLQLRRLNPSVLAYDVATERARAPHSAGSWGPEQTPHIVELDLRQRPLDRQPETPPKLANALPAPCAAFGVGITALRPSHRGAATIPTTISLRQTALATTHRSLSF